MNLQSALILLSSASISLFVFGANAALVPVPTDQIASHAATSQSITLSYDLSALGKLDELTVNPSLMLNDLPELRARLLILLFLH